MITLDQNHAKEDGTTEAIEKKLRLRIAKQRDIGREIVRVKRNIFQPVTKLFHTTYQSKHECTAQRDMTTACIIKDKKRVSQIFDTPTMCDELIAAIRCGTEKEGGRQILTGTFLSPIGTPKYIPKIQMTCECLKS